MLKNGKVKEAMMKNKVFSFISAKGGSGKTILTATISDFLAQLGKKVLIIDADGSTNGLSLFYLDVLVDNKRGKNIEQKGIFESGFKYSPDSIIELDNNVSLIPATFQFNNTDCFDTVAFKNHLTETLSLIKSTSDYDYILIDCQAGSDIHSEIVVDSSISDEIVIVSEYDPISAAGIERIKGLFSKQLTYERTWVLLNKVLPEFAESNEDFLEISRYLPPIIWDSEVVRNYARKEIALDFESGNEYTLSIIKLIRTLFDKKLKEDLNKWLNEKSEIVKKPIFEEYQEIKSQLGVFLKKEKSGLNSMIVSTASSVLASLSIAVTISFGSEALFFSKEISPIIYSVLGLLIGTGLYSVMRYFDRRQKQRNENKYEKEVLIERLKELELLKHSNIEKILRTKRNPSKTTMHNT
jgi:cellulose biosynthesis protein BcsQ